MILDIINKKRLGKELTYEELDYAFNGYLEDKVTPYKEKVVLSNYLIILIVFHSLDRT